MVLCQSTIRPEIIIVRVDTNELDCGQRKLPYPTYIGTIDRTTRKTEVWVPAGYKPRGYRDAAQALLDDIAAGELPAECAVVL